MTLSTTTTVSIWQGNGATKTFAFNFLALDADHITVNLRDKVSGAMTLVPPANYTVAGLESPAGSVTLITAPPAGAEIIIQRDVPYTQPSDLINQSGFYPETVERQLDLMVMQSQQLAEGLDQTVKVPVGAEGPVWPPAETLKGKVLAFDHVTGAPTPGPNIATVESVATVVEYLEVVADNVDNIGIVGASIDNVNALGPVAAAIGTLADHVDLMEDINEDIISVRLVGENIEAVVTAAENIEDINNAEANAATAVAARNAAVLAKDAAQTSETAAGASRVGAEAAAVVAVEARDAALLYRNDAEGFAESAETNASAAAGSAASASTNAQAADADRVAAQTALTDAIAARNAANTSAVNAAASATAADTDATAAAASALAADTSADAAAAEATAAGGFMTAAQAANTAAQAAKTDAEAAKVAAVEAEEGAVEAQEAAERARDDAQAIVGGDFEPKITEGTAGQLWRGNKTWQNMTAGATPDTVMLRDAEGKAAATQYILPNGGRVYDTAAGLYLEASAGNFLLYDKANNMWRFYMGGAEKLSVRDNQIIASNVINYTGSPTVDTNLVNRGWVNTQLATKAGTSVVTTSVSGLMHFSDKVKLNSLVIGNNNAGSLVQYGAGGVVTVATPTSAGHAATKAYADAVANAAIANIVGAAPAALDTIYEIAAELADQDSAVAAINSSLAGKAALVHSHVPADIVVAAGLAYVLGRTGTSGDTATIALASSATANSVVLRDAAGRFAVSAPSSGTDAANKEYVDTQDDLRLARAGGTYTNGFSKSDATPTLTGTSPSPAPTQSNFFKYTNTGNFTLTAYAASNAWTALIEVTNGTGAGVMSTSGFNNPDIGAMTTTVGDKFLITLAAFGTGSKYVTARKLPA